MVSSGASSECGVEDSEVDVCEEAREGAELAESAEATSLRQMRMRCCFAGGMRGLLEMVGVAMVGRVPGSG